MSQLGLNLNLPAPVASAPPPRILRPTAARVTPSSAPNSAPVAPLPMHAHYFAPDPLLTNPELGPDVEVGTSVAARLLGVAPRTVRAYCDEDVLREGAHWRRNTERSPYLIRRRAIIAKKRALF